MKINRSVIPNTFTLFNMFCGFNAVIQTYQSNYEYAAWFIIVGGLFDALDGFVARLTKSSSALGVQLDSLSDLVTFGVAPSFLVWRLGLDNLGYIGIIIASFLMLAGGLRLARFNVQLVGFDKDYFNGLPIPGQAVIICAFVLSYPWIKEFVPIDFMAILIALTVLLSLLMVSTIKYDTIPKLTGSAIKAEPLKFFVFILFVGLIVVFREKGLLVSMLIYLLIGMIRALGKLKK